MIVLGIVWGALCFLSFGVLALVFVSMKKAAVKPWQLKTDKSYKPEVSVLVPTYNESSIIRFKLENLVKVKYPKDLMQVIVVDSKSDDGTVDVVKDFVERHPASDVEVLVESERKGKSSALNFALGHCRGDVVIVSDADCFWPADILDKALPFLADRSVGAVSGPKVLLNPGQSWVTKTEQAYLDSINLVKLGESKLGSTLFFEGGFSAYKKEVLGSFDPYNTGSDDCGTVLYLAEKKPRAILVPEARFYCAFPTTWGEKIRLKIRRASQLMRVLIKYVSLLIRGRISGPKRVIIQGVFSYLFSPILFVALIATTIPLLLGFPYLALTFLVLLIPRVGSYLFEAVQNYFVLFVSILMVASNRQFLIWSKPADRALLKEDVLRQHGLI